MTAAGMGIRRALRAALWVGLALASLAASFLYAYEPTIDTPNTADETMSMTMALTGFRHGHPSFGYLADGEPRRMPPAVLMPLTQYLYGALMDVTPPMERIPRARLVARVLNACALFLCLAAVCVAVPRPLRVADVSVAVVGCACVGYMFLFLRSFCYVGSSARYDAAGLAAVSVLALMTARFMACAGRGRLAAVGLWAGLCAVINHIPFLIGMAGYAALWALWLWRGRMRGWRVLFREFAWGNAVAAAGCGVGALVAARLLLDIDFDAGGRIAVDGLAGMLGERVADVWNSGLFGYLRRIWQVRTADMMSAAWGAGLALAVERLVRRRFVRAGDDAPPGAGRTAESLTLLVLWPAGVALAARAMPDPRFTYEAMLLAAVVPVSFVALVRSRGNGLLRVILAVMLAVVLVMLHSKHDLGFRANFPGEHPVAEGFRGYARAADWNMPDVRRNHVRAAHLRAMLRIVDAEGGGVLAFDPMLALLDGGGRRFFYLWDTVPVGDDARVLALFMRRHGVRLVAVTPAGGATWLEPVGLPRVERLLLDADGSAPVTLGEVDGERIVAQLVRETRSDDPELADETYAYSHEPSTPVRVFAVQAQPVAEGGR
ncbi:hypothetical protein GGQ74_002919 [Desulfobaculum xiamenense]|uniref:Uncharacterized protein n=1 Tax=Desulfobaculum xiamenense TaxID=995050 RepID=A0A846QRS3_9BACT|nr:hypothetical protein [Desulfobaculum xiamenense]NJB69222.1 hypothetical protein [Desulfobaculum xiamenense]